MTSCKAASDVGPVAAANDQGPTTSAEIPTLTKAQRDALEVLHAAGREGCWPTSRASKGRGVNSRAADSLRRLGLARIELAASGEMVSVTAAGCAVLAELPPPRRLTKPAKAHNPLFAPAVCLCVECSRKVLAQRCPKATVNPHMTDSKQQCGDWKGHKGDHTLLVDTTFAIAEERVRLDG